MSSNELKENLGKVKVIEYDHGSKRLLFRGVLTSSELSELKGLSDDPKWVKAVGNISEANKYTQQDLQKRLEDFKSLIKEAEEQTQDIALKSVGLFLENLNSGSCPKIPYETTPNSLFAFIYAPDVDQLVHQRPVVVEYWKQYRDRISGEASAEQSGFHCLVTGLPCTPIDKHPPIQVPGGTLGC